MSDWRERAKEYERNKQADQAQHVQHLQKMSGCYICGKPSQDGVMGLQSWGETVKDVWVPRDMSKCEKCGRYVCEDHYQSGLCQRDAEGIPTRNTIKAVGVTILATVVLIILILIVFGAR